MAETVLSIVMPALIQRLDGCKIVRQINEQIEDLAPEVEFLALYDNGSMSTGMKMNRLVGMAKGRYICAVNDDDRVEPDYVESLLEACIEQDGVDVVTFPHTYYVNGVLTAITIQKRDTEESQIRNGPMVGDERAPETHWRLPGILCPVRCEIVHQFHYPDQSDDESDAYKSYLRPRVKTEHHIPRVLYHHMWNRGNISERTALKVRWSRM